jgi:hypothetical protein
MYPKPSTSRCLSSRATCGGPGFTRRAFWQRCRALAAWPYLGYIDHTNRLLNYITWISRGAP